MGSGPLLDLSENWVLFTMHCIAPAFSCIGREGWWAASPGAPASTHAWGIFLEAILEQVSIVSFQ